MIEHECDGRLFHQQRFDAATDLVCARGFLHGIIGPDGRTEMDAVVQAPTPRASYTTERTTSLEMQVQALKDLLAPLVDADPSSWDAGACQHDCPYCDAHTLDISGGRFDMTHAADCPWLAASEAAKAF